MFVYETLGLAFLGLGVLAALRAAAGKSKHDQACWFVLAVLAIATTVVTSSHHELCSSGNVIPRCHDNRAHEVTSYRFYDWFPRGYFYGSSCLLGSLRCSGYA